MKICVVMFEICDLFQFKSVYLYYRFSIPEKEWKVKILQVK